MSNNATRSTECFTDEEDQAKETDWMRVKNRKKKEK